MRVKICGVTRSEDARDAELAGASYVGANLVESSPRCVLPIVAREISDAITIPLVIVVANAEPQRAAGWAEVSGAEVIQLHGDESERSVEALKQIGPWEVWKAVRVRSESDIVDASERFAGLVDVLLLDGWQPGMLGGTGKPFPWESLLSARARLPVSLRLGMAGGLNPTNVSEAVRRLNPDVVDVSSGVESEPGVKDAALVRDFLTAARSATPSRVPEKHS